VTCAATSASVFGGVWPAALKGRFCAMTMAPAVAAAGESGRGLFVLALTSNPEGASVQHARSDDGTPVAVGVARAAAALNAAERQVSGARLGSIGLVVGATIGDAAARLGLDLAAVGGPLLAPGVGAQGAGPAELARVFGDARNAVLAASSRGVLSAGPAAAALRGAAERARDEAAAALR